MENGLSIDVYLEQHNKLITYIYLEELRLIKIYLMIQYV